MKVNTRQIQQIILMIGAIALITLSTVFGQGIFYSLSFEANNGTLINGTPNSTATSMTYNQFTEVHSFLYVIGLLLVIAVIIIAGYFIRRAADKPQ